MRTSDFYYDLPEELIAQTPIGRRDASRLLTLSKRTGEIGHRHFWELPELLSPGDCLVLNDSRVLPARLLGTLSGGGAAEVLLLRDLGEKCWECLVKPGRRLTAGKTVVFGGGELEAEVLEVTEQGNRIIKFRNDGIFMEVLERLGKMPLPPYIKEELGDNERYQNVYSKEPGSAAAPTAGLHFTEALLEKVREAGVTVCFLTLHVGLGTFRPVKADDIENHHMHEEYCVLSEDTAEKINSAKATGKRVIAVGTTSCRTIESAAEKEGGVRPFSGFTDIFIYPGYKFKCIDALVTNFHLPESTLVMLVSALAGRENILEAYREAVSKRYRFFSFGDSMFIY